MSEYTVEQIKAQYDAWSEISSYLEAQADLLEGRKYHFTLSAIYGDSAEFTFWSYGDQDSTTFDIEDLLNANAETAARVKAEQLAAAQAAAAARQQKHEAEELARARAIVARYDNRHPNEDIES